MEEALTAQQADLQIPRVASTEHRCPRCDQSYSFNRGLTSSCSHCGHQIAPEDSQEEAPRIAPNPKPLRMSRWLIALGTLGFFISMFFSQFLMFVFGSVGLAGMVLHQFFPHRCGNCGGEITGRARYCRHCGATFGFTVR